MYHVPARNVITLFPFRFLVQQLSEDPAKSLDESKSLHQYSLGGRMRNSGVPDGTPADPNALSTGWQIALGGVAVSMRDIPVSKELQSS